MAPTMDLIRILHCAPVLVLLLVNLVSTDKEITLLKERREYDWVVLWIFFCSLFGSFVA